MRIARGLSVLSFFALALAATVLLSARSAGFAAGRDDYERARALFGEKKYSEVVALLGPYLQTHPSDSTALALRGDAKASLGDDVGALKDYDASIDADPEYEYAYATRCDTRRNAGDLDGALMDCDRAIALNASDGLAFENRGDVYMDRDAYDAALADYDRAIELGRSWAYVFAARCDAERLAGKRERAPADCEHALVIDPQSRLGLWARSRLRLTGDDYTGAVADLDAYIAQRPNASDNAYYFRGYAYNRLKRYELALADEQRYISLHATDADAHAERGIARYNLGDKAGAASDLAFALSQYRVDGDDANVARVQALIASSEAAGALP